MTGRECFVAVFVLVGFVLLLWYANMGGSYGIELALEERKRRKAFEKYDLPKEREASAYESEEEKKRLASLYWQQRYESRKSEESNRD